MINELDGTPKSSKMTYSVLNFLEGQFCAAGKMLDNVSGATFYLLITVLLSNCILYFDSEKINPNKVRNPFL